MSRPTDGQIIAIQASALGRIFDAADEAASRGYQMRLEDRVRELETAVRWALGEDPDGAPDFAAEQEAAIEAAEEVGKDRPAPYWWRARLRDLARLDNPRSPLGEPTAALFKRIRETAGRAALDVESG